MSNIHGINDISGRGGNRNNGSNFLLGGMDNSSGDPRQETFCDFSKNFCCPSFTFKSFIFIVTVVDIVIYIITLFYGITLDPNQLLAPKIEILDKFGMKSPLKIQQGEVWRFITYAFLHANFVHIVVNSFSQIIAGSYVESMIGTWKTILFYFTSAIFGCIFSCLVSNKTGVGASVAVYALIGAFIGYIMMNWNYMDRVLGNAKYFTLFFILFLILIEMMLGFTNPMIDVFGHIGGLINGFFLINVIHKPNEPDDGMCCSHKIWFWISIGILALLNIGGLILFYTVRIIN